MIYDIVIKIKEFECLMEKPYSWQRIVPLTAGLSKGDKIKLIEVDNSLVPTGRILIGIIKFLSNGDLIVNNNSDILVYCENVSVGLGSAIVGSSFIVL